MRLSIRFGGKLTFAIQSCSRNEQIQPAAVFDQQAVQQAAMDAQAARTARAHAQAIVSLHIMRL